MKDFELAEGSGMYSVGYHYVLLYVAMRLFNTCFVIGLVCLCSCSEDGDYPTAPAGTMIATVNRPSPNDKAWQSTAALARIGNVVNIIGSKDHEASICKYSVQLLAIGQEA